MDLSSVDKHAEEMINQIRLSRISVNAEFANDFQTWLYNIATICIGLGGALIPLAYSTDVLNRNRAVLGSIILIVNGVSILLHKKIGMERDGRTVAIVGFMQEAIYHEQLIASRRLTAKDISLNEYQRQFQLGIGEVTSTVKDSKLRPVSYISDMYYGLLYVGLAIVISSIFTKNVLFIHSAISVLIGLIYMGLIIRSTVLAKRAEQERHVYELRIENVEKQLANQ